MFHRPRTELTCLCSALRFIDFCALSPWAFSGVSLSPCVFPRCLDLAGFNFVALDFSRAVFFVFFFCTLVVMWAFFADCLTKIEGYIKTLNKRKTIRKRFNCLKYSFVLNQSYTYPAN